MNLTNLDYWGKTKYWWLVMLVGIAMIPCGFAYWLWPVAGYAVASQIFGWLLVLAGSVQLVIGGSVNKVKGKGWWIAGGMIDVFIGFMLVRSVVLSEMVLPYFLAFIFIYWGVSAVISAFATQGKKYWWLQLINGILLLMVGFFFLEGGVVSNMLTINFLVSISFIYWGLSLCIFSYEMKPGNTDTETES